MIQFITKTPLGEPSEGEPEVPEFDPDIRGEWVCVSITASDSYLYQLWNFIEKQRP